MTSLPSLPALIAFEAVARRRSFVLAANELHLTASAVSHQMARLEASLGTKLLERSAGGVRLNASGEYYLERVQAALVTLIAATSEVRQGVGSTLYVHASPSFASLWLMPRLADFAAAHPDVVLQLSASPAHSDFSNSQTDLDIRYGVPRWPKLSVEPLFREDIAPLASAALCRRLQSAAPASLLSEPLIQSTVSLVQWGDWFAAQGVQQSPPAYSLRFDRAQLALDAAVQGLGIALESTTIADSHLLAGRLLPVFGNSRTIPVEGHFLVFPPRHAERPQVKAFRQWLRRQTGRHALGPEG